MESNEHRAFPPTRYSVVQELGDDDPTRRTAAYDALVTAYWKPLYSYLRLYRHAEIEEAQDLTQGFFAYAFEKGTLEGFDPARARFRTWLRTCLDGFVANERKARRRLKRGGDYHHVSLDFGAAETELGHSGAVASGDMEAFLHREWMRGVLSRAVDALRAEAVEKGRQQDFAIFERYDLDGAELDERPTYADIARDLGTTTTKVTNALHAMRRRLREQVLREIRAVSASEEEFRLEARTFLDTGEGA